MSPTTEGKKRKHRASDGEPPKKKKAVSYDDKPIVVRIPDDASSSSTPSFPPVIATAPGLELPPSLSFDVYENKSVAKKPELLLHSASHPRLDYTAREAPTGSFEARTKHYVGVYDPTTLQLELIPAKHLVVRSTLKKGLSAVDGVPAAAQEQEGNTPTQTFYAAKTALGEAFGTKKAKKALRSAAANAVVSPLKGRNPDDVGPLPITAATEAVLHSTKMENGGADAGGVTREEIKGLVEEAHPRPKPNIDAATPAEVYKLTRTVGRQELEMINVGDWKRAVENKENVDTNSRFVSRRLLRIVGLKDELRLKALKYLLALILWLNALETKGRSKKVPKKEKMEEAMPGINAGLREGIRRRFAPNGKELNPWDVQKVMLHACAIALVLDDCSMDMHDLQEDLRLTPKEIKAFYRELGCKVVNMTEQDLERMRISREEAPSHQVAKLRLPFELPQVRQKARAKRR